MLKGFRDFIARGNVLDLAVGVIIGAAFGAIVDSLVKDLITPLIGLVGGTPDFSGLKIGPVNVGNFINAVIAFLLKAAGLYFLIISALQPVREEARDPPPPPATPSEVYLKEIRDALVARSRAFRRIGAAIFTLALAASCGQPPKPVVAPTPLPTPTPAVAPTPTPTPTISAVDVVGGCRPVRHPEAEAARDCSFVPTEASRFRRSRTPRESLESTCDEVTLVAVLDGPPHVRIEPATPGRLARSGASARRDLGAPHFRRARRHGHVSPACGPHARGGRADRVARRFARRR